MTRIRKITLLMLLLFCSLTLLQCSYPAASPAPADIGQIAMNKDEQALVRSAIYAYANRYPSGMEAAVEFLEQLEQTNPQAADRWKQVLDAWDSVNTDLVLSFGGLPDGQETSDKLCLVVLGYQLNPDGSMQEELIRRLELARHCAEQYPAAYILCTGGRTSSVFVGVKEADVMADWLADQGVEQWRLIREDRALTTAENAKYSFELLSRDYPRVNQIAIVSSDYHIPWAMPLFQAESILENYPYKIASNAAYDTGRWVSTLLQYQARGILELAGL